MGDVSDISADKCTKTEMISEAEVIEVPSEVCKTNEKSLVEPEIIQRTSEEPEMDYKTSEEPEIHKDLSEESDLNEKLSEKTGTSEIPSEEPE